MTDYSASNDTDVFGLDAKTLGRSAINGIRVAFGIMGVVAVILGVVGIVRAFTFGRDVLKSLS